MDIKIYHRYELLLLRLSPASETQKQRKWSFPDFQFFPNLQDSWWGVCRWPVQNFSKIKLAVYEILTETFHRGEFWLLRLSSASETPKTEKMTLSRFSIFFKFTEFMRARILNICAKFQQN